jgi:hypothetical protein
VIAGAPRLAKTAAIWDATLVRMVANCSSAAIRRRCPCRADQHRHDRTATQFVVVVDVLIALRNPKRPLTHQGRNAMLDQFPGCDDH